MDVAFVALFCCNKFCCPASEFLAHIQKMQCPLLSVMRLFICALIYGLSKVSNLVSKNVIFSDLTGEKDKTSSLYFKILTTAELVKFILRSGASGSAAEKTNGYWKIWFYVCVGLFLFFMKYFFFFGWKVNLEHSLKLQAAQEQYTCTNMCTQLDQNMEQRRSDYNTHTKEVRLWSLVRTAFFQCISR